MPSFTVRDRLIWFAHCPKAGGTSVEQAMVAEPEVRVGHLAWGWQRRWHRGGWRGAGPPCSPQHLIWADAEPALERPPDAVCALVRDPVARMESEWRWQRQGRAGRKLGKLLATLPFSLWLRVVLAMARRNPYAFDNHLRPQGDFIPEGAAVFRLEDGTGALAEWLGRALGIAPPDIPHALRSGGARSVARPADRRLIGAAFAEDYRRFGYVAAAARARPDPLAHLVALALVRLERRGLL